MPSRLLIQKSQCLVRCFKNCFFLGMKTISSHAQKTRHWYLSGVLFKIFGKHLLPCFMRDLPPLESELYIYMYNGILSCQKDNLDKTTAWFSYTTNISGTYCSHRHSLGHLYGIHVCAFLLPNHNLSQVLIGGLPAKLS